MAWEEAFWDNHLSAFEHLDESIECTGKAAKFVKERALIEAEYSAKLKKLSKTYFADLSKRREQSIGSSLTCWHRLLDETEKIGQVHESVSQSLLERVYAKAKQDSIDKASTKKQMLQEIQRDAATYKAAMESHDKSRKAYEKLIKEANTLKASLEKHAAKSSDSGTGPSPVASSVESLSSASEDCGGSRKSAFEKLRCTYYSKIKKMEEAEKDYENQVLLVNNASRKYYNSDIPKVLERLEAMESERIQNYRSFLKEYTDINQNCIPYITKFLENMALFIENNIEVDADIKSCALNKGSNKPLDLKPETVSRTEEKHVFWSSYDANSAKAALASRENRKSRRISGIFFGHSSSSLATPSGSSKRLDIEVLRGSDGKAIHNPSQSRSSVSATGLTVDIDDRADDTAGGNDSISSSAASGKSPKFNLKKTLKRLKGLESQVMDQYKKLEELNGIRDRYNKPGFDDKKATVAIEDKIKSVEKTIDDLNFEIFNIKTFELNPNTTGESQVPDNNTLPAAEADATEESTEDFVGVKATDQSFASGLDEVNEYEITEKESNEDFIGLSKNQEQLEVPVLGQGKSAEALYDFTPQNEGEVEMSEGDLLEIIAAPEAGWVRVMNLRRNNIVGYVPETYISCEDLQPVASPSDEAECDTTICNSHVNSTLPATSVEVNS
eukprot:Nk52_evm27s485 gene=Nk52_evmTU27s485